MVNNAGVILAILGIIGLLTGVAAYVGGEAGVDVIDIMPDKNGRDVTCDAQIKAEALNGKLVFVGTPSCSEGAECYVTGSKLPFFIGDVSGELSLTAAGVSYGSADVTDNRLYPASQNVRVDGCVPFTAPQVTLEIHNENGGVDNVAVVTP